jgi:hypothetical protein
VRRLQKLQKLTWLITICPSRWLTTGAVEGYYVHKKLLQLVKADMTNPWRVGLFRSQKLTVLEQGVAT